MGLEQSAIVEDMETARAFGRWAVQWPPTWGSFSFWATMFVVVVAVPAWLTVSATASARYYGGQAIAREPAKQNGPQRPNFLPVDATPAGERVVRPVEGL